jgi:hypothetical protein
MHDARLNEGEAVTGGSKETPRHCRWRFLQSGGGFPSLGTGRGSS